MLADIMNEYSLEPHQMWNVDESAFTSYITEPEGLCDNR